MLYAKAQRLWIVLKARTEVRTRNGNFVISDGVGGGSGVLKEEIQAFGRAVAPSARLVFGPTEVGPFRLWLTWVGC